MFAKERKLKPCPFCGEEPTTAINYSKVGEGELRLNFSVVCPKCRVSRSICEDVEGKKFEVYRFCMNKVIDKWNERVGEEFK